MAEPLIVTPGQTVAAGDWDALVAQHGGIKSSQVRQPTADETAAARKAAATAAPFVEGETPDANDPRTHYIRYETNPIYRYYFADGTYAETRTAENGLDSAIVDYKPSAKFTQNPANKPATADTPASKRTAREEAEIAANAALPADQDPRSETNAERSARSDARIKQQGIDARQAKADADAEAARNKPALPKPESDGRGGYGYWDTQPGQAPVWKPITSGGPQADQKPVLVNGTWGVWQPGANGAAPTFVAIQGAPPDLNTPAVPGPKLPNFVLGSSISALTEYKDKLQQGVATKQWSDAWAKERWAEAYQTAQLAVQEHATLQRDLESTRNAQYNIAVTRDTSNRDSMKEALDYATKLNGLLPEGSPLGAQAFGALMGLHMLEQARSGLNSIDLGGRTPLPTVTPADLKNPQALAATNTAVASHTAAAAQNASAGTGEPPARAGVPSQPVQPAAPRPAVAPAAAAPSAPTSAGPPPPAITAEQAAAYERGGVNPATGDIDAQATPPMQQGPPADYGHPGMGITPSPAPPEPASPLPPGEVTQAQPDFPILGQYQQQPAPARPPVPPGVSFDQHPAVRASQIETTPPWELLDDDYRWAVDNGMEDAFWRVRRSAA